MRALITRPLVDARRTAEPLRDRGVEPVIEPLFAISTIPAAAVVLEDVQGYLVTSANGARALAETVPRDNPRAFALPVYAVGDATAEAAREHGFSQVLSAGGDVHTLADLVRHRVDASRGILVHAAGTELAGDLQSMLEADGFSVRRDRVYETRSAVALSRPTQALIRDGALHAAFFYSPRTAKIFADLARKAKVADACGTMTAYCLSQPVAEALDGVAFGRVRVAEAPTQESLFAAFDDDRAAGAFAAVDDAAGARADAEGGPDMTDRPNKDAKKPDDTPKDDKTAAGGGTGTGAGSGPSGTAAATPAGASSAGKDDGKGGKDTKDAGKGKDDPKAKDTPTGKDEPGRPAGSVPAAGTAGAAGAASTTAGKPGTTPSGSSASSASGTTGSGASGTTGSGASGTTGSGASGKPPAKKSGHPVRNAAIVVGVVIVAAAVAYGSMPYWRDNVPDAYQGFLPAYPEADRRLTDMQAENEQLRAQMQQMQDRLAAVTSQMGDVEARVAEAAQGPDLPADLTQRLTQMEEQLQALAGLNPQTLEDLATAGGAAREAIDQLREEIQQIARGTADASTVLAMQERLDRVAEMARQTASRQDTALGLLLTSSQLRQAVNRGVAYEAELRTVRAIADEMPGVEIATDGVLADRAETGIPTREMLSERFDRLGSEIITLASAPDDAPAWVQKTVQRLMGLVTVRRTDGEAVGDGAAAIVARASSAIEAGDLATAVQEVAKLDGEAAAAAAPWMQDAQARLAVEDVVSDMTAEALARFSATSSTQGAAPAAGAAAPATGTEG